MDLRWRHLAAAVLTLTLTFTGPLASSAVAYSSPAVDTLLQVYDAVTKGHFSRPSEKAILRGAIKGMLEVLNDPYSAYMTPEEYAAFKAAIDQHYAGIGVVLQETPEFALRIAEVYAGTPAEEAGLKAGDLILAVDGLALTKANVAEGPARIRGKAGTSLSLLIKRGEADPVIYSVTRAEIQLPTVTEDDLGEGLAYVRIHSFGESTTDEALTALQGARDRGASGVVLDLRGNGGGMVLSALEIADSLLAEGTMFFFAGEHGEESIEAEPDAIDLPVTVLVDERSASASEILAGVLQKTGRAKLVGARTFGKGTMQAPIDLPDGGVLKLSVDRWLLPDRSSPDKVGLTPDVPVGSPHVALAAAMRTLHPITLRYDRQAGGATLNGVQLSEAPPMVEEDGRIYLPLRYTMESLGYELRWIAEESTAVFTVNGTEVRADLKQGTLVAGGQAAAAAGAVRLVDGRAYVLAEPLGQASGFALAADAASVLIRTGKK